MNIKWHEDAACAEVGKEWFFSEGANESESAKAVCARCPVQPQCLHHALNAPELYGIWGGSTQRERQQLRRERRMG